MQKRWRQIIIAATLGWGLPMIIMGAAGARPAAPNNVTLRNDGWVVEGGKTFQGIFIAEEMAAVRLVPTNTDPAQVLAVHFLLGGAASAVTITVHIWDDTSGTTAPGAGLYSADFQVTADDEVLHTIDLSAEDITISGAFRVGIEFHGAGLPATATDTDGLTADRNFVYSDGWFTSASVPLGGDWIIQASISGSGGSEAGSFSNDSWNPGGSHYAQNGFLAGDIAAVRLGPPSGDPVQVTAVQFLFAGAAGTSTVTLHIWDDSPLSLNPGAVLFSDSYPVTASEDDLQIIDLSAEGIVISDAIRVGIELHTAGLPSIARDADGLTPNRNFLHTGSWATSESASLAGDWIIRAVVSAAGYRVFLPLLSK